MEAALDMLRRRKTKYPDLYKDKKSAIEGEWFVDEIDDNFYDFVRNKATFKFNRKLKLDSTIEKIYCTKRFEHETDSEDKKLWYTVVVALKRKRLSVLSFSNYISDNVLEKYARAYAISVPYIFWKTEKPEQLTVSVISKDIMPQVSPSSPADSGIFCILMIEAFNLKIPTDISNLESESMKKLRRQLAADIFSEFF